MLNIPASYASLLGIEFWLKRDSKAWTNEGESATQVGALFPHILSIYLETSGGQHSKLYLNVAHFFNTSGN
jgi:hypothetical protein